MQPDIEKQINNSNEPELLKYNQVTAFNYPIGTMNLVITFKQITE